MNRADAYALLTEYVRDRSLVRHCLAVEQVMRVGIDLIDHIAFEMESLRANAAELGLIGKT